MICNKCHIDKVEAEFPRKKSRGVYYIKHTCKKCMRLSYKKYYWDNRKKILDRHKLVRKENPGVTHLKDKLKRTRNRKQIQISMRSYMKTNKEKINAKRRQQTKDLHSNYVYITLTNKSGLTRKDIPPILLEAKRAQLKLFRSLNNK